jgi:hypothetical protein
MKKGIILVVLYTLFAILGNNVFANDEKVVLLGSEAGWELTTEYKGVGEYKNIRPFNVMALSSSRNNDDASVDLAISFDESSPTQFHDMAENYQLKTSESLSFVGGDTARLGTGAARFIGASSSINLIPVSPEAMLSAGQNVKDFSVSFWIYPVNAENGEQIVSWLAARQTASGENIFQRIQCTIVKHKLQWDFIDFFYSPDDREPLTVSVTASSLIIPKTWSHHLIRFDSDTGRMEYLVDGELEGVVYANDLGREGGDVYLPKSGNGGQLVLGNRYTGLLDEFRMYKTYLGKADTVKYTNQGGSFRTKPINMGATNSRVKKIDVSGGISSYDSGSLKNIYLADRIYQSVNHEDMQFFIRTADNPYHWDYDDTGWISFVPDTELPDEIRGKWMQIMVKMYPGGEQESSPYIDEIKITYIEDTAPPPPAMIYAAARDGSVDLSWKKSSDADVGGYLVYYGTSRADYFGENAILGESPINVGMSTSVHLDGLQNGTLYFFAVAAYDKAEEPHIGEFSREVAARPLRFIYPASY